jgi:hypothetical protein
MQLPAGLAAFLRLPDPRPTSEIDQEILDELDFHIEMRTQDNIGEGMSPADARADALRRFGDFGRIHKACRRTLLGERIMLQRIQAVLTAVLLVIVVYMGLQFYRLQTEQQASMTRMMKTLDRISEKSSSEAKKELLAEVAKIKPPIVIKTVPENNTSDVDPSHTEIRLQFDLDMEPILGTLQWDISSSSDKNSNGGFRLQGQPRYQADANEFIIPVVLKPGASHHPAIHQREMMQRFKSVDGVAAAPYSWKFSTRNPESVEKTPQPRVLSIDPPPYSEVTAFTPIRIQFDQPMNPFCYDLADVGKKDLLSLQTRISVPFPVEYDPKTNTFIFPAYLAAAEKSQLEFRGFIGANGGKAEPITIEYHVAAKSYSAEQEKHVAEAGRSAKLIEVVDAVRRNRLSIKSLEESVRTTALWADQPAWFTNISANSARFAFQGDRQFYSDVSDIMRIPFRVGSDGKECWRLVDKKIEICPFESIQVKNLQFSDPFGSRHFSTTENAINKLRLEYFGTEDYDGKICHRIRSWKDVCNEGGFVGGICDWLIDTETQLPVLQEEFYQNSCVRNEFIHRRINEPIPIEVFQAPADPELERKPLQTLEEGCDLYFLNALDGSGGKMSVLWGQKGSERTVSNGLN